MRLHGHPVANFDIPDVFACFNDVSGHLVAKNCRRLSERMGSTEKMKVRTANAGSSYPDKNFVVLDHRTFNILNADLLDFSNYGCFQKNLSFIFLEACVSRTIAEQTGKTKLFLYAILWDRTG